MSSTVGFFLNSGCVPHVQSLWDMESQTQKTLVIEKVAASNLNQSICACVQ